MLTADERQKIERRLLDERERAIKALRDFHRERETSLSDDIGELTTYRLHPADIGTEAMEQEKQFLLASNEGRRLNGIDEALRRLYSQPDAFGVCERCGADIGIERLDVVPETTMCAECQRLVEASA